MNKKIDNRKEHIFAIAAYGHSPYLEELIQSLLGQKDRSDIILCSSTDELFLRELAGKYQIPFLYREGKSSLKDDWNFAYSEGRKRAKLVTIAHQDDRYHSDYSREVKKAYRSYPDMSVFFCRYDTISAKGEKVTGISESIKRILRWRLRNHKKAHRKGVKMSAIKWGNAIPCPSCTYNTRYCPSPLFQNDYRFIIDWDTMRELAGRAGRFICVERSLMDYRVHAGAETMAQIKNHNREKEETEEFRKMHGAFMTKLLMFFYKLSYRAYSEDEK